MLTSDRRHFLRLTGLSALAGTAAFSQAAGLSAIPFATPVRFPGPLQPGAVIGVTSPSAGVKPGFRPRMRYAYRTLERMGHDLPPEYWGQIVEGVSGAVTRAAD